MRCKHCGSENVIKSGKGVHGGKIHQKYLCKDCYRGFEAGDPNTEAPKPSLSRQVKKVVVAEVEDQAEDQGEGYQDDDDEYENDLDDELEDDDDEDDDDDDDEYPDDDEIEAEFEEEYTEEEYEEIMGIKWDKRELERKRALMKIQMNTLKRKRYYSFKDEHKQLWKSEEKIDEFNSIFICPICTEEIDVDKSKPLPKVCQCGNTLHW